MFLKKLFQSNIDPDTELMIEDHQFLMRYMLYSVRSFNLLVEEIKSSFPDLKCTEKIDQTDDGDPRVFKYTFSWKSENNPKHWIEFVLRFDNNAQICLKIYGQHKNPDLNNEMYDISDTYSAELFSHDREPLYRKEVIDKIRFYYNRMMELPVSRSYNTLNVLIFFDTKCKTPDDRFTQRMSIVKENCANFLNRHVDSIYFTTIELDPVKMRKFIVNEDDTPVDIILLSRDLLFGNNRIKEIQQKLSSMNTSIICI